MYWSSNYWGMHLVWWIFWAGLLLVLLFTRWPSSKARRDLAIERLRHAFAGGEITEDEYRRRLAILEERTPPASGAATLGETGAPGK